jgi:hypothetical protein
MTEAAERDLIECHGCGAPTPATQIDAKPWAGATPEEMTSERASSVDWERLECRTCYGPGWSEM